MTGASSGLGEQLAICAAREGAAGVILSGRREDALERVRRACEEAKPGGAKGAVARVLPFDVAQLEGLSDQVAKALELFGRVDTLVLNAGVSHATGRVGGLGVPVSTRMRRRVGRAAERLGTRTPCT